MSPARTDLARVTGARVLIVEDEGIIAQDIEMSLTALGYSVCGVASSGPGAIQKSRESRPDVVLMDVSLRGDMDGIEAARRIYQEYGIPIVFLTAYADEATLRRAETAEPFGYILKPFEERELHAALIMALCRHRAYEEVEERVQERTEALARSEALLREAVRSREEFLAIAAHELRTPLTALKLQLTLLAQRAAHAKAKGAGVPPERVELKAEVMNRQVARLNGLIESLLDISRAVAGRLVLEYDDTDFKAVVEEVGARFSEVAAQAQCALELKCDEACVGYWDRQRLDQIVTNLLSNAIKYGSGKPVWIHLQCVGDMVSLKVRDFGIGISPADHTRVFERFERAVSSRHFGGFGLGLWIVKQIVTAMGGTISVQSAPGQGSEFTVLLPKHPPAQGRGPAAAAGQGAHLQ